MPKRSTPGASDSSTSDEVQALGFDKYFIRMWNYYLCYCQGGFQERIIGTTQIVLAKPDWRPSD